MCSFLLGHEAAHISFSLAVCVCANVCARARAELLCEKYKNFVCWLIIFFLTFLKIFFQLFRIFSDIRLDLKKEITIQASYWKVEHTGLNERNAYTPSVAHHQWGIAQKTVTDEIRKDA